MLLPLLLSIFATLCAAVMAYGTQSSWANHGWGLALIMASRRMQWPLIAFCIVLCIVLLALVISGKRRVWWLIGLAPVLTLFVHRFMTGPANRYVIADEPAFVASADASFLNDADYVVGVVFEGQAYAYPYACLFDTPVVVQSDRAQRLLLMWSPHANAATAVKIAREVKARDLDIVSEPRDGLLLYSSRSGQFIAALTGLMVNGNTPSGVETRLPVIKTTWGQWKVQQPETRVMLPVNGMYGGARKPLPARGTDKRMVTLVGEPHPIAILRKDIAAAPLNISAGGLPAVVFNDPVSGRIIAFDRHVEHDLIPQFRLNTDRRRKLAVLIDLDTDSGWSARGIAVDGDKNLKGRKLVPIAVQEDVYWSPAAFWHRDLKTYQPAESPGGGFGGYIGVLNPMARSTHHPARDSKMQNAPPSKVDADTIHASIVPVGQTQKTISTIPTMTSTVP